MMDAVRAVLSKYATFSGRANRAEFWWWVVAIIVAGVIADALDWVLGFHNGGPLSIILALATLLPNIAVSIRRLHDLDRTGWWILLSLLPVIGTIVLIVFYATRGTPGQNRFGPVPEFRA